MQKPILLRDKYLSVFSPNAGKCGKNADQNNSEYGHFLRSGSVCGKIGFYIPRDLLTELKAQSQEYCIEIFHYEFRK